MPRVYRIWLPVPDYSDFWNESFYSATVQSIQRKIDEGLNGATRSPSALGVKKHEDLKVTIVAMCVQHKSNSFAWPEHQGKIAVVVGKGLVNFRRAAGRFCAALLAISFLAALPACSGNSQRVAQAVSFYYAGQYAQSQQELAPLIKNPNRNYVLNNCRYGSAALAAGNIAQAQQAFLNAYNVINSVNTNTGSRVIGAVVLYDGVKVWKGQPFERAMAHYYLGLTFLMRRDYENARAAFANSLFRLRAYAKNSVGNAGKLDRVDSNFVLGYFGLGLCYLKTNRPQLAAAAFQHAQQLDPAIASVVQKLYQPATNTLIFVDYGYGPQRRNRGWYGEQTVFTPTPYQAGPLPLAEAWKNGQPIPGIAQSNMVDTLALAQDKRWLTMDTIRETKAVVGTGLMAGGLLVANNGADQDSAGTALAGLGIAALGAALAASSHADVRYWEMLPRAVYVIPTALPSGNNTLQVSIGGATTARFSVTIAPHSSCNVFYVRLR